MRYRLLGKTGIEVSEIGFGAWAIGGNMWGPQEDRESIAALRRAIELGCTFIDTALVYGDGRSEKIVAQALRDARPNRPVAVATKVPPRNYRWPAPHGLPLHDAYDARYIEECLDLSLTNLGADRVDLLQLHVWDPSWTSEDEWFEAMSRLKAQGKIGAIGISLNAMEPDTGVDVIRRGRVDAVQVVHNLFEQAPEDRLFPEALEAGVAIIARVPFDESALTGKLTRQTRFAPDDFRARYFTGDRLGQTLDRVEKLKPVATRFSGSMPELALRYCLSHEAVSTVIPGMRSTRQVEENLAASDAGPLPDAALAELRPHRWDRPGW